MTQVKGATAAVTGAASGIGRALALAFAEQGCNLALADRDEVGLAAVADGLRRKHKLAITTARLDVSDAADVARFAAAAVAAHPKLNIIVNNAGVALLGDHDEVELADMQWLMNINFWGVVYGCRSFMPHLVQQPEAHIVNVSSVFGLMGPPGQTAYAAAKFAVRGYSESLRYELEERGGRIKVSTVHPGGIKTNIVKNARAVKSLSNRRADLADAFAKMARTTPAQAAETIMAGILANHPRILIGGDAHLIDRLQRLMPVRYYKWLRRVMQRGAQSSVRASAKIAS
jgi:short-subunit dehydrogenase